MIKVCYCADDYAMNHAITHAIIQLMAANRIQATSCMTDSPLWYEHAQYLSEFKSRYDIGLHLNLTHPFDINGNHLSLDTLILKAWTRSLNKNIVQNAIQSQWQAFIDALGFPPAFIDGHQHIHQFPIVRKLLLEFLEKQKFQGWIRNLAQPIFNYRYFLKTKILVSLGANTLNRHSALKKVKQNQYFAGIYDFEFNDYAKLNQFWLQHAKNNLLIMCHPAILSEEPDPIKEARLNEFTYLSSKQFLIDCKQYNINLCPIGAM